MSLESLVRRVETARQGVRPTRRYHGYPSDTYGTTVDGTTPIRITPPNGYGWELLGVAWELTYAGGGGGGIPWVTAFDAQGNTLVPIPLGTFAAGDTGFVYGVQGAGTPTPYVVGSYRGYILPLPFGGELHDTEILEFNQNGGAADTHRLMIYVEEFKL